MHTRKHVTRALTLLTTSCFAFGALLPSAWAGPGITPATNAAGGQVFAPTYYANSPAGVRPDLVTPAGPGIYTGKALRKFVDTLPGILGLAPTTTASTGLMPNGDEKYIPVAIADTWPGDLADYYHLAVVEYSEQMHSDLPKATTLRAYVQIEEPGIDATGRGSKHIALSYPDGTPMRLPDTNGALQQVYGYDKPHYLGPTILAYRNQPTRIKWSNLLPPGGFDEVTLKRNGDLPLPVDATLAGGALPQNRVDIHLHGGLSPWISDGTPHQWTIPVGDTRYGYLTDIAVTAVGSGYSASPVVKIDPPQSVATASAQINSGMQTVSGLTVINPGANYSAASPPIVHISSPSGVMATLPAPATATATLGTSHNVSAITVGPNGGGSGYVYVPAVHVAPPQPANPATATAAAVGGAVALTAGNPGSSYVTAPTVTVSAPPAVVQAVGTASVSPAGAVSGVTVNANNFGYWTAPTVTVDPPPAAQTATAASTINANGVLIGVTVTIPGFDYWSSPAVVFTPAVAPLQAVAATATASITNQAVSAITFNPGNFGYWPGNIPAVTVAPPPAAVQSYAAASVRANGTVRSVLLANAGYGYWTAPVVTVAPPVGLVSVPAVAVPTVSTVDGAVASISVNSGNSGYTGTTAAVTIPAPPAAVRAVATATIDPTNGAVSALTVNATNFGYWTVPAVTVPLPPATAGATFTATTTAGHVAGITVTNPTTNFGYWGAPVTVVIPGGDGTARATANVANGRVTSVTLTTPGTAGYTGTIRFTIARPIAGTRATATATVANGAVTGFTFSGGSGYNPTVRLGVTVGAPTAGVRATATAPVVGGSVTAINVTNPGRGYNPAVPPVITVAAPTTGGIQATATAVVANGVVTGLTLVNPGRGYSLTSPPSVTLAAPTPSVTATATATVAGGSVVGVTALNGGSNYLTMPVVTVTGAPTPTVAPAATAQVAGGKITGITVTTAGTNFVTSPQVSFVGGITAGARAQVTANVANGSITSLTLVSGGVGYAPGVAPVVTIPAPTAGTPAVFTATLNPVDGSVSGFTPTTAGAGYPSAPAAAPTVTITAPPAPITATATATVNAGVVTAITMGSNGSGYFSAPTVTIDAGLPAGNAIATANIGPGGAIAGFTISNAGAGYTSAPMVVIDPPAGAVTATASVTMTAGAITGVTITNAGAGYLAPPVATITDATGTGATIATLVAVPTGAAFRQVPDMVDNAVGPPGYTPPSIGEGTLYYTNQQSERLLWYHDHTSGTTRLNPYMGMAAPYLILDVPGSEGPLRNAGLPTEIIPLVLQDKTFVPEDIALEDANWDTVHWGQPGDLWFPHVYETNQNPSFLNSASQAGRWDWGPWFAIVYPSMYALPSGRYGDVTTTPEAFMDTAMVNGVAYPTLTVDPRPYRFLLLNGSNDRFFNVGLYLADPLQFSADGRNNTEVLSGRYLGDQPTKYPGNVFHDVPANNGLAPWPTDGRVGPLPSEMGPPMYQIGNEAGMLPQWVQQDAVPVSYDYNRRSVTVLNVSQDNDATQPCAPKCHGLYLGGGERADVVIDFTNYAGRTLILYNDAPAPNPGYDPRIDYYTDNDVGNGSNYPTGGAPNTEVGYGPNTRTMMQIVVRSATAAVAPLLATPFDPTKVFGAGRVVGTSVGAKGALQTVYAATQPEPIVGESAYNVAFPVGYTDQYGDMYLASQNEPMFFVTNPGPLTITGIAVTGQTTATGAASGVGLGNGSTGSNPGAGSGTGYWTAPAVVVSPPTGCSVGTTGCSVATATAQVANGEVTAVTLTNPGSGYTEAPSVSIVSAYTIGAIGVTDGGSGYVVAPAVSITGGNGSGATGTATINANGVVTGVSVTAPGSGFTTQPTVSIAAPTTIAATGTAILAGDTVASVTVDTQGTYATGSAPPTVTFSAPPPKRAATISAATFGGICCSYTVVNGGSGYTGATVPAVTIMDPTGFGTGATATAVVVNGSVTKLTPTSTGNLNYANGAASGVAAVTAGPPTGSAVLATATVTGTPGFWVVNVAPSGAGSGYLTAPTVTFSGGRQATAQAAVTSGGTGATAIALTSNTVAFVVPAAIPGSGVPLSNNAVPAALPTLPCATAPCPTLQSMKVGRLMNPAIQELFEPFYGRMNATLGIEMPNQSLKVQTTLPLNYIDPATEQVEPNTMQMWKITHNGVDAHPVHFHLLNVQVVNRVGWDGTVKPPEDNEIGWKETVKMNPLEDIIVAFRVEMPQVPFGLDRSIRPQDPSQPLGVNMGFTQFAIVGLNGSAPNGLVVPARAVGVGDPANVVNSLEDYDNEYVWHCHILGHEENDFMRPLVATSQTVAPDAPTGLSVQQVGSTVVATWADPTPLCPLGACLDVLGANVYGNPKNELGFRLQRSLTGTDGWTTVATAPANTTTAVDPLLNPVPPATTVFYRVLGYNAATAGAVIGGSNNGVGNPSANVSITVN